MEALLKKYNLEEADCNEAVTECHLQKTSSCLGKNWRYLPPYLKVDENVVDDIDAMNAEEPWKRYSFLCKWRSEKGSDASYKNLIAALLAIKCKDSAEKVCKLVQEISKSPTPTPPPPTSPPSGSSDKDTKTSTKTRTSASEFPEPDSEIYEDLKLLLKVNLRNIQGQYASYVTNVQSALKAKGISARALRGHLLNLTVSRESGGNTQLKLLSGIASKLEKNSSIDDIFDVLSLECCSFLDYDIINSLVKQFEVDESKDLFKYPEQVADYLSQHTIEHFVSINPELHKQMPVDSEKLVLKLDISTTTELGKVTDLKESIAIILGLKKSAIQLLDIKEGCVVVTFLIPKVVAQKLFSSVESMDKDSIRKLCDLGSIVWLKCLKVQINFFKNQEDIIAISDGQILTSEANDSTIGQDQWKAVRACNILPATVIAISVFLSGMPSKFSTKSPTSDYLPLFLHFYHMGQQDGTTEVVMTSLETILNVTETYKNITSTESGLKNVTSLESVFNATEIFKSMFDQSPDGPDNVANYSTTVFIKAAKSRRLKAKIDSTKHNRWKYPIATVKELYDASKDIRNWKRLCHQLPGLEEVERDFIVQNLKLEDWEKKQECLRAYFASAEQVYWEEFVVFVAKTLGNVRLACKITSDVPGITEVDKARIKKELTVRWQK